MLQGHYQLQNGRKVRLEQVHVQLAAMEHYEGQPDIIRRGVLTRLPSRVAELFGKNCQYVLLAEPPPTLPRFHFFADLLSHQPVKSDKHFSALIAVWFADSLPANLDSYIQEQISTLDWDKYAKDGIW